MTWRKLAGAAAIAGLALAGLAIGGSPARAHDSAHGGHDEFRKWFGVDGGPCCSDLGRECRAVRSYLGDDGFFYIWLAGQWRRVPRDAVRPYESPDGSSYACINKDDGVTIHCFVNGKPKG